MRRVVSVRIIMMYYLAAGFSCMPAVQAKAADVKPPPRMMLSATLEDYRQKDERNRQLEVNTWIREFFRQSVLMVAREDFGMVTRDAVLGEPIDEESPDCFHLRVRVWARSHVNIVLRQGDRVLLESRVRCRDTDTRDIYRNLSESAVIFRDEVFDALADAGFEPTFPPEDSLEELPEDVEQLLQKMNHVSQFAALRRLHDLLKQHGEGSAILSGLVRGYAHMSQLSMPLIDNRHRGYGARSLVYAARLWSLDPESPVGYWNRGYAMLWIGYPVGVQQELDGASKWQDGSFAEPTWVDLQRLYLGFSFFDLTDRAMDGNDPCREQAAFLRLLAARMTSSDAFAYEVGEETRELLPYSQRVLTLVLNTSGVAAKHGLIRQLPVLQHQALKAYLSDTDPPPSLLPVSEPSEDLFDEGDFENGFELEDSWGEQTVDSLWYLGENDTQEPSWNVLASDETAWHTHYLFQQACFIRNSLGADATDFVEATIDALKEEKFRGLYRAIGIPEVSTAEDIHAVTQEIVPPEVNSLSVLFSLLRSSWLPEDAPTATGTIGDMGKQVTADQDYLEEGLRRTLGRGRNSKEYLEWVLWTRKTCKDAPIILTELMRLDWDSVADEVEGWGEKYPECPDIQWTLGKHHKLHGDIDKSIEHYERYVETVDDPHGYIGLSEAWYIKEKSDRWLEVMSMAFECPDRHLSHADGAAYAGCTLMRDGRFEDAREWTARAADSYALWGVSCHVECLTVLGEHAEAEDLARQMSERYNNCMWYDWCFATGEGDLEAAWQAKQDMLRGVGAEDDHRWVHATGFHQMLMGDEEAAIETFRKLSQPKYSEAPEAMIWCSLFAAVLADRRGDAEVRDGILADLIRLESNTVDALSVSEVAKWIYEDKGSGRISEEETKRLMAVGGERGFALQQDIAIVLAFYLQSHDNEEKAIELWEGAARIPEGWARMLAWHWLREAGRDPIHLPDRIFARGFRREQLKKKAERI